MSDTKEYKGGPRTQEGKRRSSLNAMKTGLHAQSPQALEEIGKEMGISFYNILEELDSHYRPRDSMETMLVRRIAKCVWRLCLSDAMERRNLSRTGLSEKPGTGYEKILKYERLVDIHLHRAIDSLAKKRASEKNQNSKNDLPYAPF